MPESKEKELKLPSGAVAQIKPFKGKHVRQAQVMAGQDQSKYLFAIISLCCLIDGEQVIMEDMDEMNGADVLSLMGEFGENFT